MSIITFPIKYDSSSNITNNSNYNDPGINNIVPTTNDYYIRIALNENVKQGDLIMVSNNNECFKGTASRYNYGRALGIVTNIKDGFAYYQMEGVMSNLNYNFQIGDSIYCRTQTNTNNLNISTAFLSQKTATEDLILKLGYAISANSFIYHIEEIILI